LIAEDADNTKGFFGFNGKDRELPAIFGSAPATRTLTSEESLKSFKSGFNVTKTTSPLNSSIGILHSEKFNLKSDRTFSYLLSLNFDNTYAFKEGIDRTLETSSTNSTFGNNFIKTEYDYKTSTTAMLGLNYTAAKLKLAFNALYIQTTDNLIQDQFGYTSPALGNQFIRTNQLDKTNYLNTQLLGEYALGKRQTLKGGVSFANTQYSQPDRKFFEGTKAGDNITVSYGGNNFLRQYLKIDGNFFVSGLAEYALKFGNEDKPNQWKLGYNGKVSYMESSYRFIASASNYPGFTYDINSIGDKVHSDLENDYFYFVENSSSTYKVKMLEYNNSGYTDLLLHFGDKWEVNGGLRVETNNRTTLYRKQGRQNVPFVVRENNNNYILPSINVKYEVGEKSNIRFAASKTYTRPVIMESFPLTYLNADGTSTQGNSILKNSDDYNADLKFEIFPTSKEMFAVGVFGKYLKNPIERAFIANATTSTITSFLNSDSAVLYGLEAEMIVGLERISPVLSNFSFGFNTSLLKTKVNVSSKYETQDEDGNPTSTATIETFKDTRELQGASKLLVNSDLKYQFKLRQTSNTISLVYAVFSKRIYAIGTNNADHAYELPFQQLDLVWSSKLSDHFDVKFSADNLLNPTREIEFGNNGTVPISQDSFTQSSYKKGVGFSLNLSYTF
jgi:outer membrane receptor protein involved in Fe transport